MILYLYVGFSLCYGFYPSSKDFIRDLETGKAIVFEMEYCKTKEK